MKVTTNYHPRDILEGYELTEKEREEFDYLDWDKIERGEDSASFFRYKGELYDLGEFMGVHSQLNLALFPQEWDGYQSDTYFSGTLVKYCNDNESVIVGRFCT